MPLPCIFFFSYPTIWLCFWVEILRKASWSFFHALWFIMLFFLNNLRCWTMVKFLSLVLPFSISLIQSNVLWFSIKSQLSWINLNFFPFIMEAGVSVGGKDVKQVGDSLLIFTVDIVSGSKVRYMQLVNCYKNLIRMLFISLTQLY